MTDAEVAVVGAGVAGLAASRVLGAHGARVVLIEASERVGGRARTVYEHGTPIELGPELVHGCPRRRSPSYARARSRAAYVQQPTC